MRRSRPVTEMIIKTGESVTLQCSVQSLTSDCSGEHSVYWIRHGSGESHPGIIYTHGNRSDQCKSSSETDSSTQSCVYKLPKRKLRLSDAGTYYCAVAACGQILFGNGTEVNVQVKTSDTEELQVQTVKYGENVTVKCDHNFVKGSRQHYLAWYKQSFGKQLQLIVRSAESNADIRYARAFAERFRVTADEEKFDLSIINTVDEDTGTYSCVKLKDYAAEFGSGTLLLFTGSISFLFLLSSMKRYLADLFISFMFIQHCFSFCILIVFKDERSQQSDVTEVDVKSGESVTLQCSVASLSCSGEHSVYWYRHGSGEPHPGIIYTHGNTNSPEVILPVSCCV
ncbi:hypothetical protein NFI96_028499 [Prochilodus magdalenae]|nr:hypothetical protein NFI96_028499 [Prochilodus magdalenae]